MLNGSEIASYILRQEKYRKPFEIVMFKKDKKQTKGRAGKNKLGDLKIELDSNVFNGTDPEHLLIATHEAAHAIVFKENPAWERNLNRAKLFYDIGAIPFIILFILNFFISVPLLLSILVVYMALIATLYFSYIYINNEFKANKLSMNLLLKYLPPTLDMKNDTRTSKSIIKVANKVRHEYERKKKIMYWIDFGNVVSLSASYFLIWFYKEDIYSALYSFFMYLR